MDAILCKRPIVEFVSWKVESTHSSCHASIHRLTKASQQKSVDLKDSSQYVVLLYCTAV